MENLSIMEDKELVLLSKEDSAYFAELIQRYENKLGRYISRLGRFSREDKEDILQNVFIKVYQNLNEFDTTLPFSSWIYRITHNETISFFRKTKSRPEGYSIDVEEYILNNIAGDITADGETEKSINKEILENALAELPQFYRDITILRYFEEKSYEEISDILRISPGTVATRISRAKQYIKKFINNKINI
ncbi:MAG: RNA polymerase sigma factor [Candidatus Pacebacteria bacterium]|nr:RNA polymerase sigma factor [Candidatus Paceibacterota bacterium]